jgi:hypothetical protein
MVSMFKVFEPSRFEDEGREDERNQRQDIKDYHCISVSGRGSKTYRGLSNPP